MLQIGAAAVQVEQSRGRRVSLAVILSKREEQAASAAAANRNNERTEQHARFTDKFIVTGAAGEDYLRQVELLLRLPVDQAQQALNSAQAKERLQGGP